MLTPGSKFFFGFGTLLVVAAVLYGWTSGGVDWGLFPGHLGELYFAMLGALTGGYRGGVGDHVGYTILLASGFVCMAVSGFMVAFRDNDAHAVAQVAGTSVAPAYQLPFSPNWWAPLGGLGVALMALGLVTSTVLIVVGMILIAFVAFEWMMQAWSDRATGDPRINAALRNRILNPIEVPVLGLAVTGFVAFGISRLLLAVPKEASVWLTVGIAGLIFGGAVLLAAIPKAARGMLTGVVVLSALAILAIGIVGAAQGERTFHQEEEGSSSLESPAAGGSEAVTTTTAKK